MIEHFVYARIRWRDCSRRGENGQGIWGKIRNGLRKRVEKMEKIAYPRAYVFFIDGTIQF